MKRKNGKPESCPPCQRERGEQPTRGTMCAKHQAMSDRSTRTSTSWTETLLPPGMGAETCLMYEGIQDDVIIVSSKEPAPGRMARMMPVRTIAGNSE